MAKEVEDHLLTKSDLALRHAQYLPVWATAVAKMHIDRADIKELGLKKSKRGDTPDETLQSKFPMFYQTLVNNIAIGLVATKNKAD